MKKIINGICRVTLFVVMPLMAGAQHFDQGLLWKISGKGLPQPSYVYGTMHLICPDDFVVFPGTEQALDNSNKVVLELNLSDPLLMMQIQNAILMSDGKNLQDLISESDFEMVNRFFADSLGMPLQMIQSLQPFFLITMLYPHMINCTPTSYEQYFINQANARSLEIEGLEKLEEQLNVFAALSYEKQAKMLIETLQDYTEKVSEFQTLVSHYLAADLAALYQMFEKMMQESDAGYDEFNFRLMEERNLRWIPRMKEMMQKEAVLFAVGAGHLPGEKGILNLLKQAGFKVERVVE